MRSGFARGGDGAPRVTRRVVRLLVLLGVVVAAYLALSLFDHAARADTRSSDQTGAAVPGAAVNDVADARKASPEPKSTVRKSIAPRAHPPKVHRPAIKMP